MKDDEADSEGDDAMTTDPDDALDRLWAATRPEAPSPDQFDTLWARVTARAAESVTLPMPRATSWKRWGLGLAIAAQAAALLLAAVAALSPPRPVDFVKAPTPPTVHDYSVPAGNTLFVSLGKAGEVQRVEIRPESVESEIDVRTAENDLFNLMESHE